MTMGCRADRDGQRIFHPAHYTETFKDHDVTTVVQLDTLPCTRRAPLPVGVAEWGGC